jgi:hypothetical protein
MTATAHALVGGAIAASIQNPILGLSLATVSHPLLDMIPHWDFGWGWRQKSKKQLFVEASSDLIFGSILAYLFFSPFVPNLWYLAACVFVSEVWDLAETPYWFLGWKFPPFSWIYTFQSRIQGRTKTMLGGIITQVISVLLIFAILTQIPR